MIKKKQRKNRKTKGEKKEERNYLQTKHTQKQEKLIFGKIRHLHIDLVLF